jgi:DNA-binding transcriptional regulator YdaS (Cro superfamily)
MNLLIYLSQQRGRKVALAKAIGVPAPDVSRWLSGARPIPQKHGAAIETATGGLVTRQEMFPNDWQRYWPELAKRSEGAGRRREDQALVSAVTHDNHGETG